jgi:hypothetical protein
MCPLSGSPTGRATVLLHDAILQLPTQSSPQYTRGDLVHKAIHAIDNKLSNKLIAHMIRRAHDFVSRDVAPHASRHGTATMLKPGCW